MLDIISMANASQGIKGYLDAKERGDAQAMEERKQEVNEFIARQGVDIQRKQLLQGQRQFQETMGQRKAEFAYEQKRGEPIYEQDVVDAKLKADLAVANTKAAKAELGRIETQSKLDKLLAETRRKVIESPGVGGRTLGEERDYQRIKSETDVFKATDIQAQEFASDVPTRVRAEQSLLELEKIGYDRAKLQAATPLIQEEAALAKDTLAYQREQIQELQKFSKEYGQSPGVARIIREMEHLDVLEQQQDKTLWLQAMSIYKNERQFEVQQEFEQEKLKIMQQSNASQNYISTQRLLVDLANVELQAARMGGIPAIVKQSLERSGSLLNFAIDSGDPQRVQSAADSLYNIWGTLGIDSTMMEPQTVTIGDADIPIPGRIKKEHLPTLQGTTAVDAKRLSTYTKELRRELSDYIDSGMSVAGMRADILNRTNLSQDPELIDAVRMLNASPSTITDEAYESIIKMKQGNLSNEQMMQIIDTIKGTLK